MQRFFNFEPNWFKKSCISYLKFFLTFNIEVCGDPNSSTPPRWTPVCFDGTFCKKRCSLLILKLVSCCSEILVSVFIILVCESSCWSKFERSSCLFCILRAFTRKNLKHLWDRSSPLSKVDNFDVLKGPGFFQHLHKEVGFLKTKLQRKRTALGRKIVSLQLTVKMYTILYNECFAWVKLLLMTLKWFLCKIVGREILLILKNKFSYLSHYSTQVILR